MRTLTKRDTATMSLREIGEYGWEMLDFFGEVYDLYGWAIVWDARAQRRLGQCRYREREIGLSKPNFTRVENRYLADNTLRHEIAHAIAPSGAGHGFAWRQACGVTGAEPKACADVVVPAAGAWLGRCHCNADLSKDPYVKYRLPKGRTYTCRRCNVAVEWRKA